MSTTNEEDSVQEVTTRNEVVNVAATETSMEEKDGETGNETTTTTTMKKEDVFLLRMTAMNVRAEHPMYSNKLTTSKERLATQTQSLAPPAIYPKHQHAS